MQFENSLFNSAHGALVFAFNFSGQTFDRPMMNRLAAPGVGTGKGLVGLDGAGQAGMIRAEVTRLGRLAESLIVARFAPRTAPCSCRAPCCAGKKQNKEWSDAITFLADHVRTTALAGCVAHGLLRREYVIRHFTRREERTSLDAIAQRYEIARNTASAHCAKVAVLLGGVPARKDKPAMPGIEEMAIAAINDRLREIGMVG